MVHQATEVGPTLEAVLVHVQSAVDLDLKGVDEGDYELCCLPIKLSGVEAAPARAVLRPVGGR